MEKNELIKSRMQSEIDKIVNKESQIMFFVIDTKGNPSGSLAYIYKLALCAKNKGYNVTMLYQKDANEEFVGVGEWLGQEYADIEHKCVSDGDISVSPSDVLFIPEIFANVMVQTKKLPCKRIAILQNYDYMVEQMPFSVQWGDLGVLECITNTEINEALLKDVFPYVKTTVIEPSIDKKFNAKRVDEPKEMIVNVVAKQQSDVNRIIKPFYWKYPMYRWVSFKDLRGMTQEQFAQELAANEITIWVDDDSSFGYSAIEAIKSGSIVLAKTTINEMPWAKVGENVTDACIWFDNFNELHKMLASVIRAVITDNVPLKIFADQKLYMDKYKEDDFNEKFGSYLELILANRKNEIENVLKDFEKNNENK